MKCPGCGGEYDRSQHTIYDAQYICRRCNNRERNVAIFLLSTITLSVMILVFLIIGS